MRITRDGAFQFAQAAICLICAVLIWSFTAPLDGTEFGGGRITGPLLNMADVGTLLFIIALLFTLFRVFPGAVISFCACLLTLPLCLYSVFPGIFRLAFRGMYWATQRPNFVWNSDSLLRMTAVLAAAIISLRNVLSRKSRRQNHGSHLH